MHACRQLGLGKATPLNPSALKKQEETEPALPDSELAVRTKPSMAKGLETWRSMSLRSQFPGPSSQSARMRRSFPAKPTSDGKQVTAQCLEPYYSLSSTEQPPLGLRASGRTKRSSEG